MRSELGNLSPKAALSTDGFNLVDPQPTAGWQTLHFPAKEAAQPPGPMADSWHRLQRRTCQTREAAATARILPWALQRDPQQLGIVLPLFSVRISGHSWAQ